MAVQEGAGTGMALGTAEEEEEVVAEVEVEEVEVVGRGQVVETPQGLRWEKGGPVGG